MWSHHPTHKSKAGDSKCGERTHSWKTHTIILDMEWITFLLRKTLILLRVKMFVASAGSALPGHSVHNVLLFSVNKDQKVKARGVIPYPCKDVARTMRRATRLWTSSTGHLSSARKGMKPLPFPGLAHLHYKSFFNEGAFPFAPSSVTIGKKTCRGTQFSLNKTCAHCQGELYTWDNRHTPRRTLFTSLHSRSVVRVCGREAFRGQ